MKTLEPSCRNRRAAASPIPLLPPLTRTRLPTSPRIPRLLPPLVKVAADVNLVTIPYDGTRRGLAKADGSPVASVDRALRILEVLGRAARGLSLDDVAAQLDIPKSSLHRILAALKHRRLVSQPESGGPYFLGTEMLRDLFRFTTRSTCGL